MEPKFQPSSFIPKKSSEESSQRRPRRSSSLLSIIGGLLFIIAILLAGGAFGYEKYVESRLDGKKVTLERARSSFEPDLIRELIRLDTRFSVAEDLLNRHLGNSPFFQLLGRTTLESVQFVDFDFTRSGQSVRVDMRGLTDSFTAIALQSDVFGQERAIENPIFSEFETVSEDQILFSVSFDVQSSALLYVNNLPDFSPEQTDDPIENDDSEESASNGASATSTDETGTTTANSGVNEQ